MVVPNKLGYYLVLNVFNVDMTTARIAVIDVAYNCLRYLVDLPLMCRAGRCTFPVARYESFCNCI